MNSAALSVVIPPKASAQRGENTSEIQPMIGPPIGVRPEEHK